jgi:hypothetical protein
LGVGGSSSPDLTADDTWQDEEMPLASLAPAAEIRLHPSHFGTSLFQVTRDDESYVYTSSKKDEYQQEFTEEIVRACSERGRRRGRERGHGRGRGWNPRTVQVGEVVLSDDEEVSQRVLKRGRKRGGS